MTQNNGPTPDNAMVLARNEKMIAVRDDMAPGARPAAIVPRSFAEAEVMCRALASANLVPRAFRERPQDMLLVVLTGLEVGIPPMASLRLYTTWDGVPRLMAEGIRACILQSQEIEYFEVVSCDEKHATWCGKRRGRPEKSATWTIDRAKRAGLLGKENWMKYPEDMLNARASMQLGRMLAPDVVAGMVSREEAMDGDFIEASFTETKAQAFVAPEPRMVADPRAASVQAPAGVTVTVPPQGPPPGVPQADTKPTRQRGAKPADPTSPPPASAGSSASGASSATSPIPSAASGAPASQPSKLEAAVQAVRDKEPPAEPQIVKDMWGQPIAVDPPSSTSGPTPSGESAAASTAARTSGAAPDAGGSDFGSDDPVDTQPAQPTMADFHAWLADCKTQRDLAAGLATWRAWSKHKCDVEGDKAFHKTGPATIAMQDAYSKRKSEVPA